VVAFLNKRHRIKLQLNSALRFENAPQQWALPIVRLEANVIMNLNIYRSQGVQGEGFL
jgi:hypothetical protein